MSGQVDSASQELAKLLNRLTDRVLPHTSERDQPAHWLVRYGITFIGAVIWSLTALLVAYWFVVLPETRRHTHDQIFSVYTADWQFLFVPVMLLSSALCTILIAISVRRGTALSFFLWDLSVPTLVMTILKFAFLFDGGSGG